MSIMRDVTKINKAGNWCICHHIPLASKFFAVLKRLCFPACDIPLTVELGEGVEFPHRAIGVVIHGKAKIGAGAVVLNDIPDGCVAVGVPAKIIKTGLTDGRPGRKK